MPEAYKILAQGQVATTAAAIYTVPASTQTIIKQMTFLNASTATATLDVYINGTAAANKILGTATLGAGESVVFDGTMALAATHSVRAGAGTATAITYTITGMEIT